MEGVGSRLGRASSRYGPSAAAAVFNGPVRKWKRKWVHVSPSPPANNNNLNSHPLSNGNHHRQNGNNSRLLLCRWTPLSPASTPAGDASSEEPPKRKFRYTPIAMLEEQRKAVKKAEIEAKMVEIKQATASVSQTIDKNDELGSEKSLKKETQATNMKHLDLDLCLKGHNSDHESEQNEEGQTNKAGSDGFWTLG